MQDRNHRRGPSGDGDAPAAAVIVPSFNRPDHLRDCLLALVAQEAEAFEVLVVDDGSEPPLAHVCEEFGDKVRGLRQDNAGPAAARNMGARSTRARFLAFTDDDCRPRPDWLGALQRAHGGVEDRLVGGMVVNGLSRNRYAAASQTLCDYLYEYFGAGDGAMPFFTSNAMGCSRAMFERLGGFDETFPLAAAEDRDFGLRWREAGGALVFAEEAIVDHYHALDLARFWRQHTNYGRGARHLHGVLDRRGSPQPKREPIGFYAGLVCYPLRRDGPLRLDQAALLALSQIAMVRGYAAATNTRRPKVA